MPEDRLSMRLDDLTRRRLEALARKHELPVAAIVRQAIKEKAEREGITDER